MDEGWQGPKVQRPLMGCSAQGPTAEGGSVGVRLGRVPGGSEAPPSPLESALVLSRPDPSETPPSVLPQGPPLAQRVSGGPPPGSTSRECVRHPHSQTPPQTCCFRGPGVGRRSGDPRRTLGSEGRCHGTGRVSSVPAGAAVGPHHSRNTAGDLRALSAGWGSAAFP